MEKHVTIEERAFGVVFNFCFKYDAAESAIVVKELLTEYIESRDKSKCDLFVLSTGLHVIELLTRLEGIYRMEVRKE